MTAIEKSTAATENSVEVTQQNPLKAKMMMSTRDLVDSELPSDDDEHDADYYEGQEEVMHAPDNHEDEISGFETVEMIQDDADEDELLEDDDNVSEISVDEINDIVIEYTSLHQNDKMLRSGKNIDISYRDSTIMRDFASEDEADDADYVLQDAEEDDEDVIDEEDEEEMTAPHIGRDDEDIDFVSAQEVKDIVYGAVTAPAPAGHLMKSAKVLRDGKEISASGDDTDMQVLVSQVEFICLYLFSFTIGLFMSEFTTETMITYQSNT